MAAPALLAKRKRPSKLPGARKLFERADAIGSDEPGPLTPHQREERTYVSHLCLGRMLEALEEMERRLERADLL